MQRPLVATVQFGDGRLEQIDASTDGGHASEIENLHNMLVERQAQHQPHWLKKSRTGSVGTDR